MIRLGIDIGGTFTDFALIDSQSGASSIHKRLTTPEDPARAVIEGVAAIAAEAGVAPADIAEIVHGTTLVTNALIERRGARTGMLVTEGFRDTFDIGREQRYDLYDQRLRFAEPLVPRALRAEVRERMRHDGSVMVELYHDSVRRAVSELMALEVESLAVCFLHAYENAAHEEEAARIVAEMAPDFFVSTSSTVFPYAREFERWTTTCANAYAQPMVDAYVRRLETGFAKIGFHGNFAMMGSGGGLMTPRTAREFPVRLLESGPAAGVLMAADLARRNGKKTLLSFDLGGTTAKGALVRAGQPTKAYAFEAARAYNYRSGSGLPLQIPVIDMTEIGVGGGSILAVDELSRLRVGPRSAGADPGPAAYGQGGTVPTLTDANLILGYLDPDYFLGGALSLDTDRAETALQTVAELLSVDLKRAAWGAHDVANEYIARAFRMHATEAGVNYRRATMAAFGGGGPLHAARIARKLGIPRVIFPASAGVMSAFGMLAGALTFDVIRSAPYRLDALTSDAFARFVGAAEDEAGSYLRASGVDAGDIRMIRRIDMRYVGQGYGIEVPLPDGSAREMFEVLPGLFAEAYRDVFGSLLDRPLEMVSLKAEARGPEPAGPAMAARTEPGGASVAKTARPAWFPRAGGLVDCPVHDRYRLVPGDRVEGPCLIEERESTVLLDAGDTAVMDKEGNLLAEIGKDREGGGDGT